jgi:Holliday junction DNA helicase RuvA
MQQVAASTTSRAPVVRATVSDSVLVALVGLGWSERVAAQAVEDALAESAPGDATTVAVLLRLALANLGPQQVSPR